MAEFAYNNTMHAATKMSPFFVNAGFDPRANWPTQDSVRNPLSKVYADRLEEVHQECKELLLKSRDRMARYYDKKRSETPRIKVGDRVFLDRRNIKTIRPSKKLDQKLFGPFLVEKKVGTSGLAFQLALPKGWRIHPTFHVLLLELYREPEMSGQPKLSQSQSIQRARRTQVEAQIETSE